MAGIFGKFWPVGERGNGVGSGIQGIFGNSARTVARRSDDTRALPDDIAAVGAVTVSVTALLTPDIVHEAIGKSVPYRSAGASGPGATAPLWPGGCHPRVPRTAFSWIQWLGPLVRS